MFGSQSPGDRLYFIDNLRAFVIFLVVLLHGSMTYMDFAPEWWYVVDSETSILFTAIVLLTDVPIMLILFFAAGYFVYPSLVKRGPARFLQDKAVRVGLPWAFGVLILAPPTVYMIFFSRQMPMTFGEFYSTLYWGPAYQQSVYWFLGILLLFFALLAGLYAAGGLRDLSRREEMPSAGLLFGFWALMTAGFLAMNQLYPPDTWTHVYLFMFQPLRVPLYIGYFLLGIYADRRGWLRTGGYAPGLALWLPLFLISGALYVAYRFTIPTPAQTTLLLQAGNALLFNIVCFSALMAGLAVFKRFVNGNGAFWRSQARTNYGIYYVHPLVLYPLAYLFLGLPLGPYLKAPLLILLAWSISWAISALLLTRLPGLRRVF